MKHKERHSPKLWVQALTVLLFWGLPAAILWAQTTEQLAKKALAATVYLEMMDNTGNPVAIGSGFFVRNDLIVTNYHVVEGTARGTAKLVDKYTKYTIEGVTATDKGNDLALLKVSVDGITPLPLGDSDQVNIGTQVYVAGNPKGLEGTFSDGIISSKRGEAATQRLQMTSPISPGSSGGPVLNSRGEVIGVSFMSLEGGQNLNFAIPSKYLKTLLARSQRAQPLSSVSPTVSAETYFSRGNVKHDLGDFQGAIEAYDNAIRLNPDAAAAYGNRGVAKSDLGQHVAAIADYDVAIRLKSDDALAHYNRGVAKTYLGQYVAAITDYDTAIKLKPDFALAYYNRGAAKANLGQHFAAIADYDSAIRLDPDAAAAYGNRGVAKYNLGQHAAAIADYDTAIRLVPDDAKAYYNRGVAKYRLGQHVAAITDYNTAIKLKPDDAKTYYNRGVAKGRLGQHAAAIADWDSAIRLKPDLADAYYNRGVAKDDLGQHVAAITDYDMTIRLKPDYVEAYYNRGVAKARLNRTGEAKQDIRTALHLAEKTGNATLKALAKEGLRLLE